MKNLANCAPREFLRQTNRIRKDVKEWLDATKLMDIRRRLPKAEDDIAPEVRQAMIRKAIDDALEAVLEINPDKTAELLGLMCFIEPEELDNHSMTELLGSYAEMLNNEDVVSFFTSLARWAK